MIDPIEQESLQEIVYHDEPAVTSLTQAEDELGPEYEDEPEYELKDEVDEESDFDPEAELDLEDESGDELDYDRIIGGVAERLAQALGGQEPDSADPYAEVADLMWEDPAAAIQRTVDIATYNAVQAMLPYVQPVTQGYAVHQLTHGLNEDGQRFVQQFIQEKGIDPALLTDPTVADLIRSKARLYEMERGGQSPIPHMESSGGFPSANMDAQTQRELSGMEKLYKNLGVKFDPARILGRMK